MTDRILTPDEIIQLGREYESLRCWEGVREFAHMLFGPAACTVSISVMSRYNDSRYDDEITLVVQDREGNPLGYDFTLPWWVELDRSLKGHLFPAIQARREEEQTYNDDTVSGESAQPRSIDLYPYCPCCDLDIDEQMKDAINALFTEKIGLEVIEDGNQHDPISLEFDLTAPPQPSFSVVYVTE